MVISSIDLNGSLTSANKFDFPVLKVEMKSILIGGKEIKYQTFWRKAVDFDLIIVEYALNNLTYPLCHLHQFSGVKFAYWGHERDRSVVNPSGIKALSELTKRILASRADGFFAYTKEVKANLIKEGLPSKKIFHVGNTIDIEKERKAYYRWKSKKESVKRKLGIENKKVLLFVGRFIPSKRLRFLLDSFSIIQETSQNYHLLLVGNGKAIDFGNDLGNVTFLGSLFDIDELAPIYVASDIFVYPGSVGLAPLQALCYDLPVVGIKAANHGPEVEYLSPRNSLMLKPSSTSFAYAKEIINLLMTKERMIELQANAWSSINHLTIEQMAKNFIHGINSILDSKGNC